MLTHYATSCPTKHIFDASLCTRHMKSTSKYCSSTSNIVLPLYYVNLAIGITIRGCCGITWLRHQRTLFQYTERSHYDYVSVVMHKA